MDRRIRKSQEAIQEALVDLLKDHSVDEITVSSLTKQADINRSTFYHHYKNIDHLVDSIERNLVTFITKSVSGVKTKEMVTDPDALPELFTKLLEAVEKKSDLMLALMDSPSRSTTRATFEQVIENIIIDRMDSVVSTDLALKDIHVDQAYIAVIFSSLFTSILLEWLATGLKESPEELAHFINEVAFQPIIHNLLK